MSKKKLTANQIVIYIPIIVALIAGYFGLRSATDPIKLQVGFTQTAEAKQTSTVGLFIEATTPTATLFNNITTPAEIPSSPTNSPVDIQALTIPAPTGISIVRILSENCIATAWIPYEKDSSVTANNGCWDLSNWGFYGSGNGVLMTPISSASNGLFRGIYFPISGNVEIKFNVKIDRFLVEDFYTANIGIGIINTNPPGPASAGIIYYHYIPSSSIESVPMKYGQNGEYNIILPYTLKIGSEQEVVLKLDGPLLYIIVDGIVYDPQVLQFQDRAFWVSYSIPRGNNQLIANIYNLVIEQK